MPYLPVECVGVIDGQGMPVVRHYPEDAAQTYLRGTPLVSNAGNVQASANPTNAAIVGFSGEPGRNLTTAGVGIDGTSQGAPVNQPNAQIIPVGSWVRPGTQPVLSAARGKNVFSASLQAAQVYAPANNFLCYPMALDAASGCWYINNAAAGVTAAEVAKIIGPDTRYPNTAGNARVLFTVPSVADAS